MPQLIVPPASVVASSPSAPRADGAAADDGTTGWRSWRRSVSLARRRAKSPPAPTAPFPFPLPAHLTAEPPQSAQRRTSLYVDVQAARFVDASPGDGTGRMGPPHAPKVPNPLHYAPPRSPLTTSLQQTVARHPRLAAPSAPPSPPPRGPLPPLPQACPARAALVASFPAVPPRDGANARSVPRSPRVLRETFLPPLRLYNVLEEDPPSAPRPRGAGPNEGEATQQAMSPTIDHRLSAAFSDSDVPRFGPLSIDATYLLRQTQQQSCAEQTDPRAGPPYVAPPLVSQPPTPSAAPNQADAATKDADLPQQKAADVATRRRTHLQLEALMAQVAQLTGQLEEVRQTDGRPPAQRRAAEGSAVRRQMAFVDLEGRELAITPAEADRLLASVSGASATRQTTALGPGLGPSRKPEPESEVGPQQVGLLRDEVAVLHRWWRDRSVAGAGGDVVRRLLGLRSCTADARLTAALRARLAEVAEERYQTGVDGIGAGGAALQVREMAAGLHHELCAQLSPATAPAQAPQAPQTPQPLTLVLEWDGHNCVGSGLYDPPPPPPQRDHARHWQRERQALRALRSAWGLQENYLATLGRRAVKVRLVHGADERAAGILLLQCVIVTTIP